VHVDVTLICEAPRIGPYREPMRQSIAGMLGLDVGQVSIKATTNEGLGFIGRGEGIAAMATATVTLP
jgi:2-C-methyl-D-erythritol 4-phosphate cytidylyltransferase/2-C-methyl-D-erythritol 2,4-cyclodiphosphate synthase